MSLDLEFVALHQLDGVEERVLHPAAVEERLHFAYGAREFGASQHAHRVALALARGICLVHKLLDPLAFQGGDLHHRDGELVFERLRAHLVARLFHRVHHVERHHHGHLDLHELRGEIKIALKVGRVHDVDDEVRLFVQDVVARDDLFGSVRREGVDAGKVEDLDGFGALFVDALLLVHRDARPVAHVCRGARKSVEERRFAAVRVARKCEFDHSSTSVSTQAASVLRRVSS